MVITKLKSFEEILRFTEKYQRLFIVGCGSCADQCRTGGEEDVELMKKKLIEQGKEITGWCVPDETCHLPLVKRELRACAENLKKAEAVLVMACGAGVRAVAEAVSQRVFPLLDTLSLASTERQGQFVGRCSLCGECVLGETAGLCPITICPKGMRNGPCGGTVEGKCEVNLDDDCIWVKIYENLKKHKDLGTMKKFMPAKDYSLVQRKGKIKVK